MTPEHRALLMLHSAVCSNWNRVNEDLMDLVDEGQQAVQTLLAMTKWIANELIWLQGREGAVQAIERAIRAEPEPDS